MPGAKIELDYQTPLQLVTAVILSAQCTDKRVNMITPALFQRYPDARSLADADTPELEKMIHSCGFFRAKADAHDFGWMVSSPLVIPLVFAFWCLVHRLAFWSWRSPVWGSAGGATS